MHEWFIPYYYDTTVENSGQILTTERAKTHARQSKLCRVGFSRCIKDYCIRVRNTRLTTDQAPWPNNLVYLLYCTSFMVQLVGNTEGSGVLPRVRASMGPPCSAGVYRYYLA